MVAWASGTFECSVPRDGSRALGCLAVNNANGGDGGVAQ